MTAPTEAEIREALAARERDFPVDSVTRRLVDVVDTAFQVITYTELDAQGRYDFVADALTDVWADLDPVQVARLADIVELAKARAIASAGESVRREVVAAALAFGAEHPHAARVPREAVPA